MVGIHAFESFPSEKVRMGWKQTTGFGAQQWDEDAPGEENSSLERESFLWGKGGTGDEA